MAKNGSKFLKNAVFDPLPPIFARKELAKICQILGNLSLMAKKLYQHFFALKFKCKGTLARPN